MLIPGRIARALAVFSIDEVVIFDDAAPADRPAKRFHAGVDHASYTGDTDPAHFLTHILSFLEAPPMMRRTLFPLHPNLRLTALLPSLDMPHHPNPKEQLPYREGVVLPPGKNSPKTGSLVEIGIGQPVQIKDDIPPKTRVTLRFPEELYGEDGGLSDAAVFPECIHPDAPRTEGGYYWGYSVRKCDSLSTVFTESPYEDGYDVSIGTSERGAPVSRAFPVTAGPLDFKHLLIVFGGPRGLEFSAMNDEQLGSMDVSGGKTKELFDHWINVLPNQGSRTIRSEEALLIALTALRHVWESS